MLYCPFGKEPTKKQKPFIPLQLPGERPDPKINKGTQPKNGPHKSPKTFCFICFWGGFLAFYGVFAGAPESATVWVPALKP
jgi:hypothetical protein